MMDHKAYLFNFKGFRNELAVTLQAALSMKKHDGLLSFIENNIKHIKSPYTGKVLQSDWQKELGTGTLQELGDFALGKFYDPNDNRGLGNVWITLENVPKKVKATFLGKPFGTINYYFDPGKMGSYFQLEKKVRQNYKLLTEHLDMCKYDDDVVTKIESFVRLLSDATKADKGVYVTF